MKLSGGKKLEEGAPEYVVQQVVNAILAGDVSTVSDLMSKKAKGLAASIKGGKDDHKDFDKVKSALEGATINEAKPVGARKLVMVEGKKKKVQFFVLREGDKQVVDEITVR